VLFSAQKNTRALKFNALVSAYNANKQSWFSHRVGAFRGLASISSSLHSCGTFSASTPLSVKNQRFLIISMRRQTESKILT